jgi:hypothetical protein
MTRHRLCRHDVDLSNFNCEQCAREYAVHFEQDATPLGDAPPFAVRRDGGGWICELAGCVGQGATIGRAIDAAITVGYGSNRSDAFAHWVRRVQELSVVPTVIVPEDA